MRGQYLPIAIDKGWSRFDVVDICPFATSDASIQKALWPVDTYSIASQVGPRSSTEFGCRALDVLCCFIILQDGFTGFFVWRHDAALTSCKGLTAAATRVSGGTKPISSENPNYTSGCMLNLVRFSDYYQGIAIVIITTRLLSSLLSLQNCRPVQSL